MPLRPPEPLTAPPDLFAGGGPLAPGHRWWVFQTRPRSEKAFAQAVARRGGAYFLPLYTRRWRAKRRAFVAQHPLFPGYAFVPGDEQARAAAFATRLTVREVPAPDQEGLARQLAGVYAVLAGGADPRPETALAAGQPVRILDGPYAGVEGRLLAAPDGPRVLVEVTLLGHGVSVGVERWMVRPLDQPAGGQNRER